MRLVRWHFLTEQYTYSVDTEYDLNDALLLFNEHTVIVSLLTPSLLFNSLNLTNPINCELFSLVSICSPTIIIIYY